MRYLILVFIFFTICAPGSSVLAPNGALSYSCTNQQGRAINIPIAETKVSALSACSLSKNAGKKITDFPKRYQPYFNQKFSATSKTGTYYINPVNKQKYPNAYLITTDGCDIADVMMAGPRGLLTTQNDARPVVSSPAYTPGKSVRTKPVSPGVQSVRTRSIYGRSGTNTGKSDHPPTLGKRAVLGSSLRSCKMKTYNWNDDISGTGRQVGRIPVPGSKVPL